MKIRPLTSKQLEHLQPPSDGRMKSLLDGVVPGLEVRYGQRGRPTYSFRYRFRNERVRETLGTFPAVSLAEARDKAKDRLALVEKGIDLRYHQPPREHTLAEVANLFFQEYLDARGRRSAAEVKRMLLRDLLPALGSLPIKTIERRQIRDVLDAVQHRGSGIMANRLLANTRKLFNWAVERDYAAANPCANLKAQTEETTRDRVLSNDEIVALWQECDRLNSAIGDVVKLLLLTGQRLSEVAKMRRAEIDDNSGEWRLLGRRTRNRRDHLVLLSKKAHAVIAARARIQDCDFVFSTTGKTPVSGFSKFKRELDQVLQFKTPWRLHDLRRTVASGMAALQIAPHVIEAVLNHASGTISGVAAIYNRYAYVKEKKEALDAWAAQVEHRIVLATGGATKSAAE
ncbi:MAG: tyrosine-type recombinase/integrase [Stellaceae bacterium]